MQIHTTPAMPALQKHCRTTIGQVGSEASPAYTELYAQAEDRGLAVNGPPIFVAHDLPQDAHTAFDMMFCLPVDSEDAPNLPALHCASLTYEGPLADLFERGYRPLLQAIAEAGLQPNGESREVYHVWHGPESTANRIEIQIGLEA